MAVIARLLAMNVTGTSFVPDTVIMRMTMIDFVRFQNGMAGSFCTQSSGMTNRNKRWRKRQRNDKH